MIFQKQKMKLNISTVAFFDRHNSHNRHKHRNGAGLIDLNYHENYHILSFIPSR